MNAVSELSVTESLQSSNSQDRIYFTIRDCKQRCSCTNASFAELFPGAIVDDHPTADWTDLFHLNYVWSSISAYSILTYLLSWNTFLLRNGEDMQHHAKHSDDGPVMLWEYSSITRITTPLVSMDVVQDNLQCLSFLLRLHCKKCCTRSTRLENFV